MVTAYLEDGSVIESDSIREVFSLADENEQIYKVYWEDVSREERITFIRSGDSSWDFTMVAPDPNQGALNV